MDHFSVPQIEMQTFSESVLRLVVYLLVALALLMTAGCSTTKEAEEEKITLFWPSPPDQPRFAYETALRSSLDVKEKKDKEETVLESLETVATASDETSKLEIVKPFDVAARKGKIIVSDTALNVVFMFDVPRRSLLVFGSRGKGKLEKPLGVAIDDETNYYVADAGARHVMVFDSDGHFKHKIGGPADLVRPTDVAVSPDGGRVYVVDAGGVASMSHQVVMYDKDGEKVGVIGGRGVEEGKFNLPTHATVGADGTLYVLDTGNFRVQAFDKDGKFLRAWGSAGSGYGSFARPRGIGVDTDGNIYVTDAAFRNFQIFDKEGHLLMFIGGKGRSDKPGVYLLLAGIAVDETNRAYIVDQYFKKVEVIKRLTDEEGRNLPKKK